jgi:hypothetical protein
MAAPGSIPLLWGHQQRFYSAAGHASLIRHTGRSACHVAGGGRCRQTAGLFVTGRSGNRLFGISLFTDNALCESCPLGRTPA